MGQSQLCGRNIHGMERIFWPCIAWTVDAIMIGSSAADRQSRSEGGKMAIIMNVTADAQFCTQPGREAWQEKSGRSGQ